MPGDYTIWDEASAASPWWFSEFPEPSPSGGRYLLVDAGQSPGLFYETKIHGLCENTSYEFSAFIMNLYDATHPLCGYDVIPINVRFEIWDENGTQLLGKGSTGSIGSTFSPQWKKYGLVFQSEPGQNIITLRMYNNGSGGCGNDVAIDDIMFRSCGDYTEITSTETEDSAINFCKESAPVSLDLVANPDLSVYETHAFQWQESVDNEKWQDILGETSSEFTTPPLNSSRYYRVKVAEDEVNVRNNLCSSASEAFYINIIDKSLAPENDGNRTVCSNEAIPALVVRVADDETVNWYASETGTVALAENTATFTPVGEGIYYAEAVKTGFNCSGSKRTAVRLEIFDAPEVEDEVLQICQGLQLQLNSGIGAADYLWSTGERGEEIEITGPGNYQVIVVTEDGCTAVKKFEVLLTDVARIEKVTSEGNVLLVEPEQEGDFEYSLDGTNFQASNKFEVQGGLYTIYMRDRKGCSIFTQEFFHIVLPQFITPNNDGYNDVFVVRGLGYFSSSYISIFDRFGKLLKRGKGEGFSWDGNFDGQPLPSDDYWYEIIIEDYPTKKGNFSLVRG